MLKNSTIPPTLFGFLKSGNIVKPHLNLVFCVQPSSALAEDMPGCCRPASG